MIRKLLILFLTASGATAFANEMFLAPPTEYVISGNDSYGVSAYTIKAALDHSEDDTRLRELTVSIYDASLSVDTGLLSQVVNPDLGAIKVVNDAGVYGSYFHIDIPFGDVPSCRAVRKHKQRLSLQISSLESMDGDELKASIFDPCD